LEKTSILRAYYSGCTLRRLLHGESFGKDFDFCAPIIPAAPLGDFCTKSLLGKTSILRTCCAIPAAPLGDFCTESLLGKTSFLRTCCAIPGCTLRRLLRGESFGKDIDFVHLLCYSGYTLRRLLRGVSHARVVSAAPRCDFGVVECRRPSMRSFLTYCILVFAGDFCGYITWLLWGQISPGSTRRTRCLTRGPWAQ
jgi:hypothetical protein